MLDSKSIYLEFAQMLIRGFEEVSVMNKHIYKAFKFIVPGIKPADTNILDNYKVELLGIDMKEMAVAD